MISYTHVDILSIQKNILLYGNLIHHFLLIHILKMDQDYNINFYDREIISINNLNFLHIHYYIYHLPHIWKSIPFYYHLYIFHHQEGVLIYNFYNDDLIRVTLNKNSSKIHIHRLFLHYDILQETENNTMFRINICLFVFFRLSLFLLLINVLIMKLRPYLRVRRFLLFLVFILHLFSFFLFRLLGLFRLSIILFFFIFFFRRFFYKFYVFTDLPLVVSTIISLKMQIIII